MIMQINKSHLNMSSNKYEVMTFYPPPSSFLRGLPPRLPLPPCMSRGVFFFTFIWDSLDMYNKLVGNYEKIY